MPKVEGAEDLSLSYEERAGGKFILRWRQWEQQPDGERKRKQRTAMAYSVAERKELELEISRALRGRGWWSRDHEEPPARPADVNMEKAGVAWVQWKVGVRGVSTNTRKNLAYAMSRFFRTLREVQGMGKKEPVGGHLMTPANVTQVLGVWRQRYSDGTVYQSARAVLDMWTWVSDQPEYASVPDPPRNLGQLSPPPAIYEAPESNPTLEECDAVVRRIRHPKARRLAILMRYTGLRIGQAAAVAREDLDWEGQTLLVRTGKSRREKAQMRRIPVSAHLLADLGDEVRDLEGGPLIPDRRHEDAAGNPVSMVGYRNLTRYVTAGWKEAIAEKRARPEVLKPPNRKRNRPDHAFRSALQAFLEAQGVQERIIDRLVGHGPGTTRARHYTRPTPDELRQAVDMLPAIEWTEEPCNGE